MRDECAGVENGILLGTFIQDRVMGYNHTIRRWPGKLATVSFMRMDAYVN
jgi:hypothetical protein